MSAQDRISSSPVPDLQERVLVPGEPPLTEAIVQRYTHVISWLYGLYLTPVQPVQRDKMRDFVVG